MKNRHIVTVGIAIVIVIAGCTEESSPSTSSGSTGATTASGGAGGCGVIDPSTGASDTCGTCLNQRCCDQGRACVPDATCKSCVARGSASLGDATCKANPLYDAVYRCVNGPCADACGGGTSNGGSCNQTSCSEGPAGDSLCRSKGCGACSFGRCLVF